MKFSVQFMICLLLPILSCGVNSVLSGDAIEKDALKFVDSEAVKKIFEEAMTLVQQHAGKARKNFHDSIASIQGTAEEKAGESWKQVEKLVDSMQHKVDGAIKEAHEGFQKIADKAKEGSENAKARTHEYLEKAIGEIKSIPESIKKTMDETKEVSEKTRTNFHEHFDDAIKLELNTQELVEIPDKVIRWMENGEVVVTDATCVAGLMYRLPNVQWMQSARTGIDIAFKGLDPSKPLPKFKLTRFADSYMGDSIADYVLGQIINVERNLFFYHDKQKMKIWERPSFMPTVRTLKELTVGLLGAGRIGTSIGKLLKNAGCRVIAFVRKARPESSESYHKAVFDLSVILEQCDYICNVLPSTEKTRGLLDNNVLNDCKKKPVFMNVGRGDVIKNSSIVKALKNGWISHAVLDVFEQEPLPDDDPLWNMPEVHITPHIGAFPQCEHMAKFIAENYFKYINGEPLMNVVDWENGY